MLKKIFTIHTLTLPLVSGFLLFIILILISEYYQFNFDTGTFIAIVLLFFLLVLILNAVLLNNYIDRKVKKIYSTFFKTKQIEFKTGNNNIKSLKAIEKEIEKWSDKRSSELSKLKENDEYRKEFIGNISHELKTPIFIAQSYIETLLDGSLYDDKVNKKHLKKALKSVLRLSQIVKDLEMISKLEKDSLILKKEVFDINFFIRDIVDSLEFSAKEENINIILNIDKNDECYVFADEEKIEQVIINLLVNAIKYNEKNGFVKINCKDLQDKYLIEIEDNGLGIEPEKINRIFERFYRIDKDRSRKKGGTGLGLSIVKHILDAHGQSINVESEYGKGTKFYFTLDKAQ